MGDSDNTFDDHDEVIRQMKEILEGKAPVASRRLEPKKRVRLPKGADLAVLLVNSLRNNVREAGGLAALEEFQPEAKAQPIQVQVEKGPIEPRAVPAQAVAAPVLSPRAKPEIAALPQVDIPPSLSVERIATSASWPPAAKREGAGKLARLLSIIRKKKRGAAKRGTPRKRAAPAGKTARKPVRAPMKRLRGHPRSRHPAKLTGRQKLLALLARRRRK